MKNTGQIDNSTYKYFYELVDRLVKWMNNYEYCPFDIYGIYISKDYEGTANYSKHIHIRAGLSDSEVDINKFLKHSFSNRHTNDSKFQHEVLDWFKIGKYGGFPTYGIYQNIGSFKTDDELIAAMHFLEVDLKRKYPDIPIDFSYPEPDKEVHGSKTSEGGCIFGTIGGMIGSVLGIISGCESEHGIDLIAMVPLGMIDFGISGLFVGALLGVIIDIIRILAEK